MINNSHAQNIMNRELNVLTVSQSGLLYRAMIMRQQREAKRLRNEARLAKVRSIFSGNFKFTPKKWLGTALAKLTYTLWENGYFASFDEFTSPRSA